MPIPAKIKRARTLRLLSQKELAVRTGFSRPAIAAWEVGRNDAPKHFLDACAYVLKVDRAWFDSPEDNLPPIDPSEPFEPRSWPPPLAEQITQQFNLPPGDYIVEGTVSMRVTIRPA